MKGSLRDENRTAHNKGFALVGVLCFTDSSVQGGSSVPQMKFRAKTPRHRPLNFTYNTFILHNHYEESCKF
jgi:hypothetical protein